MKPKLLTLSQYLDLLPAPTEIELTAAELAPALVYASRAWPDLALRPRRLSARDVSDVAQSGDGTRLIHIRAFPRKRPETFVIVACRGKRILGHILFDVLAEYQGIHLDCRQAGIDGEVARQQLAAAIRGIDADADDPFAILSKGDGTYMQTYRKPRGFILEHQLVNTSSHYRARGLVDVKTVVAAMQGYGFGKYDDWLPLARWSRVDL